MSKSLRPWISIFLFTKSLFLMLLSSNTKFFLDWVFSCHEISCTIVSSMVKINQKIVQNLKVEIQKQSAKMKKCLLNSKSKIAMINEPHHFFSFSFGKCFSKEVENKKGGSILFLYLAGKWFSREVENKQKALFLLAAWIHRFHNKVF